MPNASVRLSDDHNRYLDLNGMHWAS
eukprot:SAG22_NODE_8428_length_657_cov_1.575269_1_plen_25_part_10